MIPAERTEHSIYGLSKPAAHYSDLVSFGGLVYMSGLLAVDSDGTLVGGDDVSEQSEQVFRNMALGLQKMGCDFADLLKINVYLTSVRDRAAFDAIRRLHFGATKPASTLVEVSALAVPGAKIEVEAIAALKIVKED